MSSASPAPTATASPPSVPSPTPTVAPVVIPANITLDLDPSLTAAESEYFKRVLSDAIRHAVADLGVPAPALSVFAYRDQAAIEGKRAAWTGASVEALGQRFDCDLCAEATHGALFLRFGAPFMDETRFPRLASGRSVLTHELFHGFQFQALGEETESVATRTPPSQVRVYGPAWLGEGSAQWLSYRVVSQSLGTSFPTVLEAMRNETARDPIALDQMESPEGFRSSERPYDTSLVAVDYLINGRSPVLVMNYYAAVGKGQRWQDAFTSVFGIEIAEFYRTFAAHRASLSVPRPGNDLPRMVSGTLTSASGSLPESLQLSLCLRDSASTCWRASITGSSFNVTAPPGSYVLTVQLGNRIAGHHAADGLVRDRASATVLDLSPGNLSSLSVSVP